MDRFVQKKNTLDGVEKKENAETTSNTQEDDNMKETDSEVFINDKSDDAVKLEK